jgi:amino acid transporter
VDDSSLDNFQKLQVGDLPRFAVKLVAAGAVLSVYLVQICSARMGVRLQNLVTVIKVLLLSAIPLIAIVHVSRNRMPDASRVSFSSVANFFRDSSILPSQYALALYSGLWAFDGWDQVSYIAGEMRDPRRDVPLAVHASTLVVSSGFIVVVLSYFLVLPPLTVARTNSIALDFGSAVFGSIGGVLFAGFVAFSCLGALNGHMYTYSRLAMAAGRDSFLPSAVGKVNAKSGTPVIATTLCTSLVLLFVVFGSSFASLVNFCGVCAWFWYGLTVSSLLYLRVKEPNLHRPYETWLITPILFISTALFLLIMPIFAAPYEALAALLFIAAGVPIYYVSQNQNLSFLRSWLPARSHNFTAVPTDVDDIQLESSSHTPFS